MTASFGPQHPLPFIDLAAQQRRLGAHLQEAIARVLAHGQYIMGPEVQALEMELAAFCGAKHAIACASGTDALALVLMAKGVKPGQAILCPAFTFAATAEVIAWLGATPVFVDILPDTFNMDPAGVLRGIESARRLGLSPVGVIAVDLFGQPADYDRLEPICRDAGLWLLDDAAQAFGAIFRGRRIGTFGDATATSFFPAKPLGCYGDGGAVFTDDDGLAAVIRSLRVHGEGADKYDNVRIGLNARLDTIQAAVLLEKLKIFPDEIERRNAIAERYSTALAHAATVPTVREGCVSTWAQYTIRLPAALRDEVAAALKRRGIPTAIYYRRPLHRQPAYRHFPLAGNGLPHADAAACEALSLPMHAYLETDVQDAIIAAVCEATIVNSPRKQHHA